MIIHIIKKIFQESRLKEYSLIIDMAIENGYVVTSLADWYENNFYPGKKVLILRHDVDLSPRGALKMWHIEKSKGVKSTMYFRWFSVNKSIIHQIINENGEVSLHYETLASYCKKNRIYFGDLISTEILTECLLELKKEIKKFEIEFGKIKTISSHGDNRNVITGIPNYKIIENIPRNELGIYFETYDKNILEKFNKYISDSSINNNHLWKYGISPQEAIKQGVESICLLTHPEHWHYSFTENIRRLWLELLDNF